MSDFTASGARRTGDEYQDLQSAEVLVDWLENPSRYQWVRLEAMDGSLDDIQAEESDGRLKLLQVKFGVDPANEWSWEDFAKQEAGRKGKLKPSLLMKWATSLAEAQARATVAVAAIVTNRAGCTEVLASRGSDGRIDFPSLPDAVRTTVSAQLGGEDAALAFFTTFQFRFLDPSPDVLAEALLVRFVRLGGTREGWYGLLDSVRRWINRQNEPRVGGRILFAEVLAAANWHRPPSIPQSFRVPEDYVAPETWSEEVVEPRLDANGDRLLVVTGSPGIGKSTYLSWLLKKLTDRATPVVRHHFFLSTTDKTPRRTAWQTAADTIVGQLQGDYPNLVAAFGGHNPNPEMLRDFLEEAGRQQGDGPPLVVIVDGLDHVWRNSGTSEPLNQLFDLLLPVPDGVVVLVGTQSIDATRLPLKLREQAPRDRWAEVPRLDAGGVRNWLQYHRLDLGLSGAERHEDRLLDELADAFYEVSAGHPLILHYAYNAARQRCVPVRADQVRELPRFDPSSEVAGYYQTLWSDVSPYGHTLLHLLAGFPWAWPQDGLVQCLSPDADPTHLDEAERATRHLLGRTPAGVTAFHESLLAFVRSRPDHDRTVSRQRNAVIRWLAEDSPPYWQWRYEWAERSRDGRTELLIESPTLSWCVDALTAGRSRQDIAEVIAASGWAALRDGRLDVATERHLLDAYLDEAGNADGVSGRLRWIALHLCDAAMRDDELELFLASKDQASDEECGMVAEVAFGAGKRSVCRELLRTCGDRWNAALHRSDVDGSSFSSLEQSLPMLIAASLGNPAEGSFRRSIAEHGKPPPWCQSGPYARSLAWLCRSGDDTGAAREELRYVVNSEAGFTDEAVDEVVRLACMERFDPDGWVIRPEARRNGLFRCYRRWVSGDVTVPSEPPGVSSFEAAWKRSYGADEDTFVDLARSYFFYCLASAAEGREPDVAKGVAVRATEVTRFLAYLRQLALEAATDKDANRQLGGPGY